MWPVAKSGNQRLRKESAIQSLSARPFAEPWPDVARSQEREPEAPQIVRDPVPVGKAFAEPWPERPAAKRQERENGSTSVETTGHLSVAL